MLPAYRRMAHPRLAQVYNLVPGLISGLGHSGGCLLESVFYEAAV